MYQLLISDESRLDIFEAFYWYESCRQGLGKEFEFCLEKGLHYIQRDPLLSQKSYRNIRVHFIDRFPYGIHFLIENDVIRVFGIFHTSRNPRRWIIRLRTGK